ncbi:hypothetical protein [Yeosuana marina]|uniref:hypothetical protein n=1 Tax=Yeosuana marina TaxID=1565536 RepID=UPI0030ECE038|tara:strand:- start:873 stop:1319 length:447 start_codon:yes stop_codon:yes gene_type:complete
MKIKVAIAFILFSMNMVLCQDKETSNNSNYYKAYFTEIRLTKNFVFQQEMNSRTEVDYKAFEFPLLFKYNVTKKISFLIGPKFDLLRYSRENLTAKSEYITFGVQYDVSKSSLLYARYNYRLTAEIPIETDYTFGSKSSFNFGTKIKF